MTLFYGKKLAIDQPTQGYKISVDSILLAACINQGHTVLDVGAGVGATSLCLMKRNSCFDVTGIELQKINVEHAIKNADCNHLSIKFLEGDILNYKLKKKFDHVMSNPPFYEDNKINEPMNEHKRLSNVLKNITLHQWLEFCIQHSNDYVTIIHLPEYLEKILIIFSQSLKGIRIYPIFVNNQAKRIIVQGSKKNKSSLILYSGLILRDQFGYTKEAVDILENTKGIHL